jgi:septal ring factor EnvC (AmiA/AmiB activator)
LCAAQAALLKLPDNQVDALRSAMEEIQKRLTESESGLAAMRQELQNQQTMLAGAQAKLTQLQKSKTNEEIRGG